MRKHLRILIVIASVFLIANSANAAERVPDHPRGYVCSKAIGALTIDGSLNEPAWRRASFTDPFVDIEGNAKPRPDLETKVKLLWDDNYLYIGASLEEPNVWATLTEHDSVIFYDNDFEIFIDPDGDRQKYFEIEVNALATEWDLFLPKPYRDGGSAIDAWEVPGLKVATHVDGTLNRFDDKDRGWTVEIAIPWRSLTEPGAAAGSPPRDGDQLRINFSRVEWRTRTTANSLVKIPGRREENWVWSPQGVVDMHRPEMWGYVQFSTKPAGEATFEPDPTHEARMRLIRLYEIENEYRERHEEFTSSLETLGLDNLGLAAGDRLPRVDLREGDFDAFLDVEVPGSKRKTRVHIRSDGRIRREEIEGK
jgi:hypothetical protein